MRFDDFDFELPRDRIAQEPAAPRDSARLLVVDAERSDRHVSDLPELLRAGDMLVVNDTRVIPVRLSGRRGQANVSVTLHTDLGAGRWLAFARPARRLRQGDRVVFADDLSAAVGERTAQGDVALDFERSADALFEALDRYGAMPLPPYIRRDVGAQPRDRNDYQTMFADRKGAIAAPTAGLHFTPALMERLAARGVGCTRITLHVGIGTFLPVKADSLCEHSMHAEYGTIEAAAAASINAARQAGGRVVAVGTTCVRLLESAAGVDGVVQPFRGETDLFIAPGRRFRAVDLMMTNFHLPRSTLFVLVSAFAGRARMLAAYRHAIEAGYRFYSYGDACLLSPGEGTR